VAAAVQEVKDVIQDIKNNLEPETDLKPSMIQITFRPGFGDKLTLEITCWHGTDDTDTDFLQFCHPDETCTYVHKDTVLTVVGMEDPPK